MADAQENALLSGYRAQYQQDIERRREKEQQDSADALEWRKGELNEVRQAAFDAAIKVGASPAKAKIAAMAPDFIPGVGEGLAARDVVQSLERDDYIGAGIYGLAGVAGAIPGVGDVAGQTLRAGARKLRGSGKKGIAAKPKSSTVSTAKGLGRSKKEQQIIEDHTDQPLYHTSRSVEEIETFDPKAFGKSIKGNIASGEGIYATPSLLHSRGNYYHRAIPSDIQNKYIQKGEVNKLLDAEKLHSEGKLSPEEVKDLIYDAKTYEIKLQEDFNPVVITSKKGKTTNIKNLTPEERKDFLQRNPDYEVGPIIKHKGVWNSQRELEEMGFEGVIDASEKFKWTDEAGISKHEVAVWPSGLQKVGSQKIVSATPSPAARQIDNNDSKFQKGGTNMSDVDMYKGDMEDQMMLSGLVSEPDDVDPVSGNEIPLGATAEGVRDDETVSISPGEFVIPDYAVRYHGIDFYMESLQKAKQGLQQMEQMGMVGNPDNATMPEEAPLPTMDTEDQPSMATEDEPPEFQTGGLTTVALPQVPQQQAILQAPILTQPTVAGQATQPVTQPVSSTITQPLRPISTQPVPVAPTFGQLQPQAPTYTASQGPTAGLPGGYSIEEFVNDAGNSIFLTTIGGQVTGGVPPGYRKVGTDNLGYAQPYTQPSGFDLSDIGDTAEGAATALGALTAFNTLNKATDGKLLEGGVKLLESIPGGKELVNFAKETGGNVSELITGIFKQGTDDILKATGIPESVTGSLSDISINPLSESAFGGKALPKLLPQEYPTTPEFQALVDKPLTDAQLQNLPKNLSDVSIDPYSAGAVPQAVTSLAAPHTAATAARVLNSALAASATNPAVASSLASGLGLKTVADLGTAAAAKQAAGIANFMNASGAAGATTAAGTGGFGAALAGAAPFLIPAAIMALPTISNMISGSSNRVQAGRQATNKVQELLFSTTFNETNAQRIRALAGIKGDKGQYGEVPSEGQVSSLSSTLGGIDNLGGIEAIPTAAGRELYKILKAESSRRILESKREAITTDADDADRTRQYTPEQVEREYRERMSGAGSGGSQ